MPPLLTHFASPKANAGKEGRGAIWQRLKAAPSSEQQHLLATHVQEQALKILGMKTPIDPGQPLQELGLDSLMAVELRNALAISLEQPLPATILFSYPTIDKLAGYLAKEFLSVGTEDTPAPALPNRERELAQVSAELDELSEGEMAALLSEELGAIRQRRTSK
jgi:acyl carrier protein